MKPLRYTELDSERANTAWKASCGPHSIAAACEKTLDEVRAALRQAGVNYRGWMNPTDMTKTLSAIGQRVTLTNGLKAPDLCEGINRVQFEGKWLNPGVPPRVAYFHTHYVAHFNGMVLCTMCLCDAWVSVDAWCHFLRNEDPPSPFHITHHWKFN